MLKTIILLTATQHQQNALSALLVTHNPGLSIRKALTLKDLEDIEREVWQEARLVSFTSGVIVPRRMLEAAGHGAYNFHPGPPDYPGWAPAHFAIYHGTRQFGATMHVMAEKVDSGPIVDLESFIIPDDASVRDLEQIAYMRLAHLFWRKAHEIACEARPLPTLPISWSGTRSTRRMYEEYCALPVDIDAAELRRRIRAFDDDFRGIPLTITLHGICFRLNDAMKGSIEPRHIEAPPLAALQMRA